jgi:hypothetical protein
MDMRTAVCGITMACVSLLAASGCGGGSDNPTSPSGGGATIAGTVSRVNGAPLGLTVAVGGTNLSSAVGSSGYFQIGGVPRGDVQLKFKDAAVEATAQIANVAANEFIEVQVQLNGATATILSATRSAGKLSLCHRTESGAYQLIDISVNAEPAHRDHGDAKIGEPVPGTQRQVFDQNCLPIGPAVRIEKSTNGEEADTPPGPSLTVGSTVTWRYVVTNSGTINLTGIAVVDDKGVAVNCNGQTTLGAGQLMTCTGSGVATLGQYRNVGTVTASSASGSVNDSDASHYLGLVPQTNPNPGEQKIQICHRTGAGFYNLLEISVNAEPAHRAHGDAKIGEPVPGNSGKVFGAGCSVQ